MENQIYDILTELLLDNITKQQATDQLLDLLKVEGHADSDKLVECKNCGDKVEMISSGEFCPHCFC